MTTRKQWKENCGDLFASAVFDETDKADTKRLKKFLRDYKKLCEKHGCLIIADGTDVEAAPHTIWAEEDDPWGVIECTRERGWKI